tara:strand:+ start:2354 stop:4036 length:1683 start_codon:yes stop_codon:yes gene_type:complete
VAKKPDPKQVLEFLKDPRKSLPNFGQVHDQKTGQFVPYDPLRITKTMQMEVMEYLGNTPRTEYGQTKFLTILTARQMGKSLSVEYGCYPKAAYSPGWDHVCIADNTDRAEYLHKRVHHLHGKWPESIKSNTVHSRESRQLTFKPETGGKMRVLSAESGAVGIGQSPDSFHASECAFWADFSGSMFLIWPSLANRDHALAIFECTPWEARSDWHEHCLTAKNGEGRHLYKFFPFWDGHLNRRPWQKDWVLDNEEINYLHKYSHLGLQHDHLAFRRFMLNTDQHLKRRPELFNVFYPFDDISCWIMASNAAIPDHALEKHRDKPMVAWNGPYMEYEQPQPGAYYVMGVDPCGHAARDHASFQVLKCYEGEWTQVACYAEHSDPLTFTQKVVETAFRYNKANIVVESNGVGQGVLSLLRDWNYPNVYFEKKRKPGFTSTAKSIDQALGWVIDGLLDELVLNDRNTVEQLMSYKNDKRIEEGVNSELNRGQPSRRKRDRHHWDKVSALMMAVIGAHWAPRRRKPDSGKPEDNVLEFRPMTYDERQTHYKEIERKKRKRRDKYWI